MALLAKIFHTVEQMAILNRFELDTIIKYSSTKISSESLKALHIFT